MKFPGESEYSAFVQKALAAEFNLADRFLRFWVKTEKNRWLEKSRLPVKVLHLAMGLHTQACRQMRTIIEECSRCEGFGADITARALFETILALLFVVKPKVHIVTTAVMDGLGKQKSTKHGPKFSTKLPDKKDRKSKSNLLSRELRAELYLANVVFQHEAIAEKCRRLPGAKRVGRMLEKLTDPVGVASAEAAIGPVWTSILRNEGCYSGLSVAGLSLLLHPHLFRWYVKVYCHQSSLIHGSMAVLHIRKNADQSFGAQYLADVDEVRRVLFVALLLFRVFTAEMQRNIGFGVAVESALHQFLKDFDQIFMLER